ncbi:UbiA prenyltransferase family protein [Pontibacter ramchanderi]|uniref:UbiA prenyltransferase family protein n=1 Tax=Pontibacter ramchanderi TaxID=1179743 RepID=A0A2N3UDG6_9BACT|nr:UbiA family prenyltransferase [Pontibacter ramchanderi]PKV67414.1 UbiA prenyltransferase family protein [Pontibacter ramchanderi]
MLKKEHSDIRRRQPLADWLRAGIEALLYSSVFISLCAFGLTVETYLLTGLEVSLPMAGFVFLATLFTYNTSSLQRMWRGWRAGEAGQPWSIRHQRELAVLAMISLAGAVVLFFLFELRINLWFVLVLALISVGYTVPLAHNRLRPFRSIPLLKVFLIALVWSAVTVLFPLIDAAVTLDSSVMLIWLRRFLFILALALLFDIRDYTYDRHTRTLTFPGLLGEHYTRFLSLGLLLLYLLLVLLTEEGEILIGLLSASLVAGLIVWHASEEKPRIYYALLADGAMLVHFAFVYLAVS